MSENYWKANCPKCGSDRVEKTGTNSLLVRRKCHKGHIWIINPFSGVPILESDDASKIL